MDTIRMSILTDLLNNKQTTRRETRPKRDRKIRYTNPHNPTGESSMIDMWVDVPVDVHTASLAGNVSLVNIERMAAAWLPAA